METVSLIEVEEWFTCLVNLVFRLAQCNRCDEYLNGSLLDTWVFDTSDYQIIYSRSKNAVRYKEIFLIRKNNYEENPTVCWIKRYDNNDKKIELKELKDRVWLYDLGIES